LVDYIKTTGGGSTTSSGTVVNAGFPASGVVRGVVTKSQLYFGGSYSNTMMIQDKDSALWIRPSNTDANAQNLQSFKAGDIVEVTITEAKNNYGMLMATKLSAISKLGGVASLYYQEGDYSFTAMPLFDNPYKSGALYKKTGDLNTFDKFQTLQFGTTGMYTTVDPIVAQSWTNGIAAGKTLTVTVYGPLVLNYSTTRIYATSTNYVGSAALVTP